MKVTSVNEKKSSESYISLETEPPLTRKIFEIYKELHDKEPGLLEFEREFSDEEHLLTIKTKNFQPFGPVFPTEFIETINRLLEKAEMLTKQKEEQLHKTELTREQQRKDKVQATAKALGLPVR